MTACYVAEQCSPMAKAMRLHPELFPNRIVRLKELELREDE
jgi:hypothetical protein